MNTKEMTTQESRSAGIRDPFREFRALTGMSDVFDDALGSFPALRLPAAARAWAPKVNIKETEKEYIISAALPGVKKEDVKISVENGVLQISGDYKDEREEKGKTWLRHEMGCGCIQRSFVLPAGTHPEDIKAAYKDGLLTVTLVKPAHEKSRGVNVKVE